MSIREELIADVTAEAANTLRVLEAVPADRLAWRPHEKSMTLAVLAGHLAEIPGWVQSLMEDDLDFAGITDYTPFIPSTRAELLETFRRNVAALERTLGGKDDAFLAARFTMRNGETLLMQLPRHAALRTLAIHHTIHHRGQLTVYLRLLGCAVPQTYGPTADNPGWVRIV